MPPFAPACQRDGSYNTVPLLLSRYRYRVSPINPVAPVTHASDSPFVHISVDEEFDEMFELAPVESAAVEAIKRELVEGPSEATVSITNDAELQRLNSQFRGADKPTAASPPAIPSLSPAPRKRRHLAKSSSLLIRRSFRPMLPDDPSSTSLLC
jgi:hypothetical protein